jgi:hypothetical protein
MAHSPPTLRLKVDADCTAAGELTPRIRTAIHEALEAAERMGVDDVAGAAAYAVMIEILQVRKATPAEAAIARVRALHRDWENDPGHCAHCTGPDGNLVAFPCPTIRALNGEEQ